MYCKSVVREVRGPLGNSLCLKWLLTCLVGKSIKRLKETPNDYKKTQNNIIKMKADYKETQYNYKETKPQKEASLL